MAAWTNCEKLEGQCSVLEDTTNRYAAQALRTEDRYRDTENKLREFRAKYHEVTEEKKKLFQQIKSYEWQVNELEHFVTENLKLSVQNSTPQNLSSTNDDKNDKK